MESGFSADHSLTEHARRMNSLCRLCEECVKRGEKDKNRRGPIVLSILMKFYRFLEKILSKIQTISIQLSSAINHQLPEKNVFWD